MAWLRLDDGFAEHPKVSGLTDRAFRLHVTALCHCARNLTDGLIERRAVQGLRGHVGATAKHLAELVAANLWHETEGGYRVNDYTAYNLAAGEVKASRVRNAERQARFRQRNPQPNASRNGGSNTVTNAAPSHPKSDSSKELGSSTTWQPAFGVSHPAEAIRRQISNGAIADRVDLDAELTAHQLEPSERLALITLLEAKTAA